MTEAKATAMEQKRWHILLIIIIHVVFYFAVNTTVLVRLQGFENIEYNLNYMNAVKNFFNDPTSLYESPNPQMRLRTFPPVVLYYAVFPLVTTSALGGYLTCITWMLFWNVGSAMIIEKISSLESFKSIQTRSFLKDPRVLILLYLCSFWQSGEYYSAPPNVIAGFFVILGMYYVMQSRDHLGFLSWGISMTFKLYPAFLIIFFLLKSKKKDFVKNLLFLAISMLPTFLMFLAWPSLLSSFVMSNIETSMATTFSIFPSGSLARLISIILPIPFLAITLVVFAVVLPVTILLFLKFNKNMNILDQAILAFTCGVVVFPDFYPGHSIIFWGIFLLWIATRNDYINGAIKLIYFITIFYFIPPIFNFFYAIPFFVFLISLLIMISRPGLRNQGRVLMMDSAPQKILLYVYMLSAMDITIFIGYLVNWW